MILFRPVGLRELHLIAGSGFRAFPPRLAGQDIFYPVLDRAYAEHLARDWNTKDEASGYAGFVTRFEIDDAFARHYPVHVAGAADHRELWVPAADLLEFNLRIIGKIEVVAAYAGERFKGEIDRDSNLPVIQDSHGPFEPVYRLKDDHEKVAAIQRATLTTKEFGIEPTHGLLGSAEWWSHLETGELPIKTLRGVITRVYMASMNDWPEFEVRAEGDAGVLTRWTRESNSSELERSYAPGRRVEIDYVIQRHRPASFDGGAETEIVLEIRVGRENVE